MLRIESIKHDYDGTHALADVTLDVEAGEAVGLFGSNGAGKTTLLKVISALERPSSGQVLFEGRDLVGMGSHEVVKLGIVQSPEGRRLFGELSIVENLDLGAATKEARAYKSQTMAHVFDLFPTLADRRSQLAGSLSGGEQQMCAIARALMARPRLLLLDEPSLGLAPLITQRVFDALEAVRVDGMTILIVEQNVAKALKFVDRGYVIERGKVVMQGTAEEMLSDTKLREAYLGV